MIVSKTTNLARIHERGLASILERNTKPQYKAMKRISDSLLRNEQKYLQIIVQSHEASTIALTDRRSESMSHYLVHEENRDYSQPMCAKARRLLRICNPAAYIANRDGISIAAVEKCIH